MGHYDDMIEAAEAERRDREMRASSMAERFAEIEKRSAELTEMLKRQKELENQVDNARDRLGRALMLLADQRQWEAEQKKKQLAAEAPVSYSDYRCGVCGYPQFFTTEGRTCPEGHKGADILMDFAGRAVTTGTPLLQAKEIIEKRKGYGRGKG
jgi:rubrerythrin